MTAIDSAVEAIVAAVRTEEWEPDITTRTYYAEFVRALGDPMTLIFAVRLPDAAKQLREAADLLEAPRSSPLTVTKLAGLNLTGEANEPA
jgi:hypothetical protein